MRRKDREMDVDFAYSIIDNSQFATIAMLNEDNNPYCIPISPARQGDKIYIHSAYQGSKIENIKRNPKISMSFVGDVKPASPITKEECDKVTNKPKEHGELISTKFTTEYESAVVFGSANIVEDKDEKILGLRLICEKYLPYSMSCFDTAIDVSLDRTCVIRIDIDEITGKRKKFDKDGVEMKWGRME